MSHLTRPTLPPLQQKSTNSRRLVALYTHLSSENRQNRSYTRMTEEAYSSGSEFPPLKPGLLRIYSMRFCPWAQRTRLVLEHKNIPHETININLKDKPAWFLEKNPLGLVPVLELDDKIVYESTATCDWLDDVYPENRLQPSDPYRKAWDRIVTEYFGKLATTWYKTLRSPDDKEVVTELENHYKFFEKVLEQRKGPFFGDDKPALVDFLIWPHFERVVVCAEKTPQFAIDEKKFPRLAAWAKAATTLHAVKATAFDAKTHFQFIESFLAGKPDYNIGLRK